RTGVLYRVSDPRGPDAPQLLSPPLPNGSSRPLNGARRRGPGDPRALLPGAAVAYSWTVVLTRGSRGDDGDFTPVVLGGSLRASTDPFATPLHHPLRFRERYRLRGAQRGRNAGRFRFRGDRLHLGRRLLRARRSRLLRGRRHRGAEGQPGGSARDGGVSSRSASTRGRNLRRELRRAAALDPGLRRLQRRGASRAG